jgi:hypothetical protein
MREDLEWWVATKTILNPYYQLKTIRHHKNSQIAQYFVGVWDFSECPKGLGKNENFPQPL